MQQCLNQIEKRVTKSICTCLCSCHASAFIFSCGFELSASVFSFQPKDSIEYFLEGRVFVTNSVYLEMS